MNDSLPIFRGGGPGASCPVSSGLAGGICMSGSAGGLPKAGPNTKTPGQSTDWAGLYAGHVLKLCSAPAP